MILMELCRNLARPLFITTCFIPDQIMLACTIHALKVQSWDHGLSEPHRWWLPAARNSLKTHHMGVPWSWEKAEAGGAALTCFRVPAAGGAVEVVAGWRGCAGRRGSAVPGDFAGPWGYAAGPWGSASPSLGPRLGCSALRNGKLEIKDLSQCGI